MKDRHFLRLLMGLALLACAGIGANAFAADPDHAGGAADGDGNVAVHDDGGGHGHAAHTVHGLPPGSHVGPGGEFLYVDLPLFFWTLGVFLVTAVLLRKFAWGPIIESLENRERLIADGLTQAERAEREARRLMEEHEKEMGGAHEEARRVLEEARALANREGDAIIAKARAEAAETQERLEHEIEEAKRQALGELRDSAVDLAARIGGKTVGKQLDPDDYRDLVEEATR